MKIEPINENDISVILDLADIIFVGQLSDNKAYINSVADWSISVKLLLDGEIIGFYLFSSNDIPHSDDASFINKNGIEGIALGVSEKYRGKGYGKMLIDESYRLFSNKFDYIWGLHLKSLNNIEDWKKRRTIIDNGGNIYISYKFL